MFKKLVSNLPFNPSMVHQIGFYADRLHAENSIRRLSFVFMALVVALQSLAIISPPEISYAADYNDIISGQLQTRDDILRAYDDQSRDIKQIFDHFTISREDLAALSYRPNATIRTNDGNDYISTGRSSLWDRGHIASEFKRNEQPINYTGASTPTQADDSYIYARQLRAWDVVNPYNSYTAFRGTSSATGQTFWLLTNCGNITWIGEWEIPQPEPVPTSCVLNITADSGINPRRMTFQVDARTEGTQITGVQWDLDDGSEIETINWAPGPPPESLGGFSVFIRSAEYTSAAEPRVRINTLQGYTEWCPARVSVSQLNPDLDIRKTVVGNPGTLNPGDTFTYKIEYRNSVIGSVATDVHIEDQLDLQNYTIVSPSNLPISATGYLNYPVGDLPGTSTYRVLSITARLKDPLPNGTKTCNVSSLTAENAGRVSSGENDACITVVVPCPFGDNTNNPNCIRPTAVCTVVDTDVNLTTRTVSFRSVASSTNAATTRIISYSYDFGDDSDVLVVPSSSFTDERTHTYAPGDFTARVTVTYEADGVEGQQTSELCAADISFEEDGPLGQEKLIKNITQGLEGQEAQDSAIQAGDVLEYTLITHNSQNFDRTDIVVEDFIGDVLNYTELDVEALEASGGRFDEETNKVIWENVTIPANSQVASVFTVTTLDPIPATNRPSVNGSEFDCRITNTYGNSTEMSVQCPLVKVVEQLPVTGPGSSMITLMTITTVAGYFFARSRLMQKELQLVRTDYAVTGGM